MPRRTVWPGLASLSRRFTAEYRGDQLAEKFPGTSAGELIRSGVLVDIGFALTLGECICEERRGECHVRVDVQDGVHHGYCNEAGRPIPISPDRLQRYCFDWGKWASWLRLKNQLNGAGPTLGAGVLFVGAGTTSGREFGLVVVAPGCRRAADLVMPEGARQPGRALVALLLGEPTERLPVDATVPATSLGADLATIDGAALAHAIDAAAPKLALERWSGPALAAKQAAKALGYQSGQALLKAVSAERIHEGDPLYILRQRGPGRTPGGRFHEDAVAHVAGLLAQAGREYEAGVAQRREQARAVKASTARPDPAAAERRIQQVLARQERESP